MCLPEAISRKFLCLARPERCSCFLHREVATRRHIHCRQSYPEGRVDSRQGLADNKNGLIVVIKYQRTHT